MQVFEWCISKDEVERAICSIYLKGVIDGMVTLDLAHNSTLLGYCSSPASGEGAIETFQSYLTTHWDQASDLAAAVFRRALANRYGC